MRYSYSGKKINKKIKNKSSKPPYSLLSNTVFTFKEMWHTKKALVLSGLLVIVLSPVLSILNNSFPAMIVSIAEHGSDGTNLILTLGSLVLVIIIIQLLNIFIINWSRKYYLSLNYHYIINLNNKSMMIDYALLESTHGQNMKNLAFGNVDQNDTNGTSNAASLPWNLIQLLSSILNLSSYVAILSVLNPQLIVVVLVSSIIPFIIQHYYNVYCYRNREEIADITRKLVYATTTKSDLRHVKDAIFYKTSNLLLSVYWKAVDKLLKLRKKRACIAFFSIDLVTLILVFLQNATAYAVLIYRVLNGYMDIASFVFYFSIITGFAGWIQAFMLNLASAQQKSRQFCDLRVYLDLPDRYSVRNNESTSSLSMPNGTWSVEFRHVYFHYPSNNSAEAAEDTSEEASWILNDVSFRIEKGEKAALVGLNGAGKTTIVKMLCGLLKPTKGRILINDKDLDLYNRNEYLKSIAAVFQDIYLLPLTIKQNIVLCCNKDIDEQRLNDSIQKADLGSLIEDLPDGLDTYLVKSIRDQAVDLSGGQKQKLALARALYKGGNLIILDEPTASLDPIAEKKMYLEYDRLTSESTALFVSHRLSSTRFCDMILLLDNGKIIESGSHDQLMMYNGKYAELFRIQASYYKEEVTDEKNKKK